MKQIVKDRARLILSVGVAVAVAVVTTVAISAGRTVDSVPTTAAAPAGPNATFADPVTYPSGTRPWNVSTADVNGDDITDILTVNGNDNQNGSVSVLLGKGDGTFGKKTDYEVDFLAFGASAADVTGDGNIDIAVTGGETRGYVAVLAGDGTGEFTATEDTVDVGYSPNEVATEDVNGDGALDLLTSNYFASTVSVVLNRGNGTFGEQRHYMVGPTPQGLSVVDVNGDGVLDVATGGFGLPEASLSVLLGNGDGTFQDKRDFAAGESVNDVGIGDFNGDGVSDGVTAEFVTSQVSVLLGKRSDSVDFAKRKTYAIGSGANSMVVADINGDGFTDVLTSSTPVANRVPSDAGGEAEPEPDPGGASVLHGKGNGTFSEHVLYPIEKGGVSALTVADVDGDSLPDLVGTVLDQNQTVVWLNTTSTE